MAGVAVGDLPEQGSIRLLLHLGQHKVGGPFAAIALASVAFGALAEKEFAASAHGVSIAGKRIGAGDGGLRRLPSGVLLISQVLPHGNSHQHSRDDQCEDVPEPFFRDRRS